MSRMADRFERLLDIYRRADGRRWGGQDLEDATDGAVTRSYVSTLRKGKIESPGFDKLEAIAGAMGFAPELWFENPSGIVAYPSPSNNGRTTISERLEHLFETVTEQERGEPYTNARVARMSFGGITEEEVAGIRSGTIEHPTLDQVLALSEAFGVDVAYFTQKFEQQEDSPASLAREESTTLVHKTLALSEADRKMVLDLLDHLGRRGAHE